MAKRVLWFAFGSALFSEKSFQGAPLPMQCACTVVHIPWCSTHATSAGQSAGHSEICRSIDFSPSKVTSLPCLHLLLTTHRAHRPCHQLPELTSLQARGGGPGQVFLGRDRIGCACPQSGLGKHN
eukprot:1159364-Pelagomonas_calceolata.AAC.4